MRIVIADPMRSRDGSLACILASVYGLRRLSAAEHLPRGDVTGVAGWAESGGFPDGTILQQHVRFSQALADALGATPTTMVAIVRDPYDAFVSAFNLVQAHADRPEKKDAPRSPRADIMAGKPIDHPDVIAFLGHDYRNTLVEADEWGRSGEAILLRYEDLVADPVSTVRALTDGIAPVAPETIERAVR